MMRALVIAALALALLAALLLAGNAWANARVWNARVEIRDEKIPAAFDGFVLCQVSDVHNEARGEGNAALLRALREAAPDLICITGDFLDSRRTDLDFALELAGQLAEIAPAVYVTGNHEARLKDLSALEAGLAARGVQVLRDDWTPLARGGEEIALLGLDDPGFAAGEDWTLAEGLDQTQARLSALLAQAGDRFSLVLSHRPELLPAYAEAGADLYPTLEIAQAAGYAVHAEESDVSDSPQGYAAPAVEVAYFFAREGDANGADVSLVLEGEEERLVRCSHGNGPAPDHVCESAWLDGTLYQGADCLTAMFGDGALDAAAD